MTAKDPTIGVTVTVNITYTPASGTVLNVSAHTLYIVFIPTDSVNYSMYRECLINVLKVFVD
jgi:hypothetical protein